MVVARCNASVKTASSSHSFAGMVHTSGLCDPDSKDADLDDQPQSKEDFVNHASTSIKSYY